MTHEWKIGDRFSVEGVVTASADREGDYRALFDGHETDSYVIGAEMTHAKLIQPNPRYDWSNIPAEYEWMATDRGGTVHAYKNRPVSGEEFDYWFVAWSIIEDAKWICKGKLTEDWRDSLEQRPEEVEASVKVAEEKALDLSKPMRTKNNKVPVNYLTTDRLDFIWVQEVETKIVLGLFARDLENTPEPKKTTSQEVYLHEHTDGFSFFSGHISRTTALISKARITHTEGEGWSIEEVK